MAEAIIHILEKLYGQEFDIFSTDFSTGSGVWSGKKDEEFDYGEGLNSIMGGLGYLFVLLGLFALIAGIWKHLSGEFSLYYFGFGFGLLLVGASLTTAGAVSRIERKYVGD